MSTLQNHTYFSTAKLLGAVFITFIFLHITVSDGWGAINVAILPFQTDGDDEFAYLTLGIQKILCSRIALRNKIYVIDQSDTIEVLAKKKNAFDIETIQSIGYHLDADYIITGVLSKRGSFLTIDGKIVVINSKESPLEFSVDCEMIDEVISKASQLAHDLQNNLIELQKQAGHHESLRLDDKEKIFREERLSPGQ